MKLKTVCGKCMINQVHIVAVCWLNCIRIREANLQVKTQKKTLVNLWFLEKWSSDKGTTNYPHKNSVYRPTVRITKDTPTTFTELTPEELKRAKSMKAREGRVEYS